MPRILLIASCVLASLYASLNAWAVDLPSSPDVINESYPGNQFTHPITLPPTNPSGDSLSSWEVVSQPTPDGGLTQLGSLAPTVGQNIVFTPADYGDQNVSFTWRAMNDSNFSQEYYTYRINVIPVDNPPAIQSVGNPMSFSENQNIVGNIVVFDPDTLPPNDLRLEVNGTDGLAFDANFSSSSGQYHTYQIWYTPSPSPNYEALTKRSYSVDFNSNNRDSLGNVIPGSAAPTYSATINLTNVEEPPVVISESAISRTINEGEDTDGLFGFQPMLISAMDPEAEIDPNKKITWSYSDSNNLLSGSVSLFHNNVSTPLDEGATSSYYNSGDSVTVNYVPTADAYGTQVLTFTAKDSTNRISSSINITVTVAPQDDDPITLNEASAIGVTFVEEGTGVVYDFNTTDPDSNADPLNRVDNNTSATAGRQIFYTLSGADKDLFQISANGELSFLSAPDYETPLDLGGANPQDNFYKLTVEVRDSANAPYNSDSQDITVEVTPLNELPTLAGGTYTYDIQVTEDVTWTWNSAMRDMNSTMIDLNASDVDAGQQALLSWRIKPGGGGSFGTASVSGTGRFPTALSYIPDLDFAGDGNSSNPDDTFIVEVFDGVGSTEITFRVFIDAQDDPPRVQSISPAPLETLSVYRERYTINLYENSPSTVRLQFNEVDGGGISNFLILPGLDSAKFEHTTWTSGATYADINFTAAHLPDFEDNQSSDGDGNYSIVFRVYDDQTPSPNPGKYKDLYLDFIIQNMDEAPTFAPSVDFNQTVLENQKQAVTLTALDSEGVSFFYWDIIYGFDSPKFELNSSSGTSVDLRFIVPPNYEAPLDEPTYGDKNNTYVVRVKVSDAPTGGKSTTQTFVISVADDNDFPTITPVPLYIDEPLRTSPMLELSQYALDEDNRSGAGADILTWSKISGDTTAFALDQNGSLRFNQESDFETNSSFSIEVRVSDDKGGYDDANFTIAVNAQNEAPDFYENNSSNVKIGHLKFTLDEDTSISSDLSHFARDPESGLVGLAYGHNFNDSNGSVILDVVTGAYTFTPSPNYSGLTYVDFTVSDGILTGVLPVVLSVTSVPDPPVVRESNNSVEITSTLTKAIIEGNSSFAIELNATDPYDSPSSTNFIWNLQGPDSTNFKVEPNVGPYVTLSLLQVPDFESPHDSNGDNTFDFNVSVTDDSGSVFNFPVQISIGDGPEPPYFDYGDNNQSVTHKVASDFPENGTGIVFDAHAFDLDGSPIVYGLTDPSPAGGGLAPDNALFYIHPSTGKVSFISPPNFEIPQDDDNNSVYVLELNATDDPSTPLTSNKIRHFVTVTVTNVIEPPVFTAGASRSINWNETTTTMIEANQTTSEDLNETIIMEISGGADAALFDINVATNLLTFKTPADYENPASADGDNIYHVQVMIKGTSTTQDLTITVRDENDNPVINNPNLTQLTVDENQMFVIDLDVTDQDFGSKFPDILYTKDSNSSRFVTHTGNESSVGAFYPAVSSGMVDNQLPSAFLSVAGDLDQDGDADVVCLERNQSTYSLHYLRNNGSGIFSRVTDPSPTTPSPFALDSTGKALDHLVISDLDQDGDKDIIMSYFGDGVLGGARISWLRNNGGGIFDPEAEIISRTAGDKVDIDYFAVGDLDGDSYPDLVVAWRDFNSTVWFKNNRALDPKFTLEGYVMSPAQGLVAPRSIELVDIDNSGSLDVIISANQNLYLAVNDGSETVFTISTLTSFTGAGLVAKAVDLTQDGLMDVVYATSMGAPSVIVQNSTGFDAPISLPSHADPLKTVAYPTDIAILPATQNTRIGILVADASINYLSLFEASPSMNGQFDQPVHINTGLGVENIALADLNLQSDYLSYSFVGGEDQDDFNATRFKDEGKLYFKKSPDFEKPEDAGQINRYDVLVKITDNQGGETVQPIAVSVNEINDPPVITSLDGNYSASYKHNESSLYTLFEVNANNDEHTTQTLTYSLAGGVDESNFTIDSVSGRLSFVHPPDFEAPSDSNKDNAYNVIVRVTDDGQPSAYDEQNITINVVDGDEPPKFAPNVDTSHVIDEDTSLAPFLLTATDQNTGGTITSFGIETNGTDGNGTVTSGLSPGTATFEYIPDGNFTGTDTVVVNVTNDKGLTVTLPITITVNSINDPPEIRTSLDLNHSENQQVVTDLDAKDDSGLPLVWTWADGTVNDPDFLLTSSGNLSFRLLNGPDYESPDQNKTYTRTLRVTDSDGNYTDGNLTINVINVNDNRPYSPYLTKNASSTFTLIENNTTIIDLNASDADNLSPTTYSITGGPDSTRFSVTSTGLLSLLPAPDFERPSSADKDNIYQAELTLSDGGYVDKYPIRVTVTDADENAPKITSDGGGALANISVYENTKVATQIQATDVESNVFTFSTWGGTDQSLFEINSTTGELSFITPPDFEKESDHDQDNFYEVYVRVSDGYSHADQNITIQVTDEDEIPMVSPAILYTTEDVPIVGVTFTVSDPEGKISDSALLTPPAHGSLEWSSYPLTTMSDVKFTYTPAPNFHGTDYLVLRVTDSTLQGDVTIPIEINSTNDPPTANPDEFIYDDPTGAALVLDVLANDSSAPDSNRTDTLQRPVEKWTQPLYGKFDTTVGGETVYVPADDFIGVDTFQYTVYDLNDSLESTGDVTVIVKRAKGLPNWRFQKNFGNYNLTDGKWSYHTDLGWLYVDNSNELETATWIWHDDIGWFWTGDKYAPNVYLNDLSGWFAFTVEDATGGIPKKYMTWPIYDQTLKKWMTLDELRIARVNKVLAKFTSADEVVTFVQDSPLFTSEEKVVIKTELTFTGTSSTLLAKGFTLGY